MQNFLINLKQAVTESRPATRDADDQKPEEQADVEAIQEQLPSGQRSHARSISSAVADASSAAPTQALDPLGVLAPSSPTSEDRPNPKDDGFE